MLSTFLNFLALNLSISSFRTGWILSESYIDIGDSCRLNPHTRIRFSSSYCNDNSMLDLFSFAGVLITPGVVYYSVVLVMVALFINLYIKLVFGKLKKIIVFLEVVSLVGSFSAIVLFNDAVNSQNVFVASNSHVNYTGYNFQLIVFFIQIITSGMSVIKLKLINNKKLVWIN